MKIGDVVQRRNEHPDGFEMPDGVGIIIDRLGPDSWDEEAVMKWAVMWADADPRIWVMEKLSGCTVVYETEIDSVFSLSTVNTGPVSF